MTLTDADDVVLALRADLAYPERYRVSRPRTETLCFGGQLVVQESAVQTIAGCDLLVGEALSLVATERGNLLSPEEAEQLRAWAIVPGLTLVLSDLRDLPDLSVCVRSLDLAPIWEEADSNPAPHWTGTIALTVLGAAA